MLQTTKVEQQECPYAALGFPVPIAIANDLYVPDVLSLEEVDRIMALCKGPLQSDFRREQSQYADLDELRLIHSYFQTYDSDHVHARHYQEIESIALTPRIRGLLAAMNETPTSESLHELVLFRMGPGTYNHNHSHRRIFSANILLQDNPRSVDSLEGMYFTTYLPRSGVPALENSITPDEPWGPGGSLRHVHSSQVGGLHGRKKNVGHGVNTIEGDRKFNPDPEECRWVLSYVTA